MADTGFVLAGTGASDSSIGTIAWLNPGNITASDDTDAEVPGVGLSTGEVSEYLKGTNNSISVPAGATIDGIVTRIEGDQGPIANRCQVTSVKCVRSGTIEGTDNADSAQWPDADATKDLGGATDLWGLSWTVAQANASTTGHVWSGTATNNVKILCDAMWRKVWYTESGGGTISINKSESVTVADSPTVRLNPLLFDVSDSVTVADSPTVRMSLYIPTVSDAVSVADSPTINVIVMPSVADAITVAEAVTARIHLNVNIDEPVTVADAPTVSIPGGPLEINAADAVVVIDAPTVIFSDPQISVSDTITVGESTTTNVIVMPAVADAVTVVDAITMNVILMPNVADAISIAESVRVHVLLFINVNDAVTVADAPTVSVVAISALQINVSDAVTLAEVVTVTGPSLVATESLVGERWKASVSKRKKGAR